MPKRSPIFKKLMPKGLTKLFISQNKSSSNTKRSKAKTLNLKPKLNLPKENFLILKNFFKKNASDFLQSRTQFSPSEKRSSRSSPSLKKSEGFRIKSRAFRMIKMPKNKNNKRSITKGKMQKRLLKD
jgi:hypothetical protein